MKCGLALVTWMDDMITWADLTFPPINLYNMVYSKGVLEEFNKLYWKELSYLWSETTKDNNETKHIQDAVW